MWEAAYSRRAEPCLAAATSLPNCHGFYPDQKLSKGGEISQALYRLRGYDRELKRIEGVVVSLSKYSIHRAAIKKMNKT